MSVSLTRFSWWYWSNGKEKETKISSGSSDSMKLSSFNKKDAKISSSEKKVKRKWNSREERKMMKIVDKEYDVVLVPSDGVCCLSASDDESSYDSDWSIGWMEPHAPDFYQSDDENVNDASFAVLVPCYRNDCKAFKMDDQHPGNNNHVLNVMANGKFPAEGNKYMEEWIASLQNF